MFSYIFTAYVTLVPRSVLTLLLLLHYLLVVCAGVRGPADRPITRPFAYVHSHDCQVQNAWRGGVCFDGCNGVQYHARKGAPPVQQLLATLKGVDLHCLPLRCGLAPAPGFRRAGQWAGERENPVPAGVRVKIYAPPRRG